MSVKSDIFNSDSDGHKKDFEDTPASNYICYFSYKSYHTQIHIYTYIVYYDGIHPHSDMVSKLAYETDGPGTKTAAVTITLSAVMA